MQREERLSGVLQDLLDEAGRAGSALPERNLMCAVLGDAAVCLFEWRRRPRRAAEAYAWVASPSREWPYSFENLCDALGFHAARLRRRLLENVPTPDALLQAHQAAKRAAASASAPWVCSSLAGRARAGRDAEIIRRRAEGRTLVEIAHAFGLSPRHVQEICNRDRRPPNPLAPAPGLPSLREDTPA